MSLFSPFSLIHPHLEAQMDSTKHLKEQIFHLENLLSKLSTYNDYKDKCAILNALPSVQTYINQPGSVQKFLSKLFPESDFVMKSIIAIGQAPIVFNIFNADEEITNKLLDLLERLLEIEVFYRHIGGVIGYHLTVLKLIVNSLEPSPSFFEDTHYVKPEGLYLNEDDREVRKAVRRGIEHLSDIAMIYPIGGAGDRLNFKDEKSEDPLPVALLPFLGRTLLEGMIRDLQAKEFLSFKLTGKQVITPIAIMTSIEKKNNIHIFNICKSHHWFGRSAESFYLFIQPLVPVITI